MSLEKNLRFCNQIAMGGLVFQRKWDESDMDLARRIQREIASLQLNEDEMEIWDVMES